MLAPAKLNLYLHVLGRADGHHLIESLVVFTRFGDRLEVREGAGISLSVEGPFAAQCGPLEDNLVLRAAHSLAAHAPGPVGAKLILHKNLPVASGLGGGSSDAAAAIRLLMRLWDLHLDDKALAQLALGLGADVPVCLYGRPAIMRGAGERLSNAPLLPGCYVLLVNPGVSLATRDVFARLNGRFGNVPPTLSRRISTAKRLARYMNARENGLQLPAIELAPEIQNVLDAICAQKDCLLSRMSGSGATCFGLFDSAEALRAAAGAIRRDHPAYWQAQTRLA